MLHWFEEPCIFVFFGVVNGGIFLEYISMVFTVACLCSATVLHNSEYKKSRKRFFFCEERERSKKKQTTGAFKERKTGKKTIPTLKGKTRNFLSLTAAARYNEFILSEQLRTHVKCRAALCTIANLPTRVHKGHRYQHAVERWEVLQMSEQVLEWQEMHAADAVKEMACNTSMQMQTYRPPGCWTPLVGSLGQLCHLVKGTTRLIFHSYRRCQQYTSPLSILTKCF